MALRGTQVTPAGNTVPADPTTQNARARSLILQGGVVNIGGKAQYFPPAIDMWQPQNPNLPSGIGPGSVLTFQLLQRRSRQAPRSIRFTATVTAGATSTQNLTKLGLANLVSNVIFTDLGNNQRINSTGWHLTAVSSAKRRKVFGAAYTSDTPLGYGNNNNRVMFAPAKHQRQRFEAKSISSWKFPS